MKGVIYKIWDTNLAVVAERSKALTMFTQVTQNDTGLNPAQDTNLYMVITRLDSNIQWVTSNNTYLKIVEILLLLRIELCKYVPLIYMVAVKSGSGCDLFWINLKIPDRLWMSIFPTSMLL